VVPRLALVGDQVSDVIAAHRAGVRAVGYANKSGKIDSFKKVSADLIVASMAELFVHV
jgi:phosphoglycolate phosphatase-like HAD superfamily hydrolase